MTGRQSIRALGGIAQIAVAPAIKLRRSIIGSEPQIVRLFLVPFKGSIGAVHPDSQIVFLTRRELGRVQDAAGTIIEVQQDVAVVVQGTVQDAFQIGAHFSDFQTGDVVGQIFAVGADITDAVGDAGSLRIGSP